MTKTWVPEEKEDVANERQRVLDILQAAESGLISYERGDVVRWVLYGWKVK